MAISAMDETCAAAAAAAGAGPSAESSSSSVAACAAAAGVATLDDDDIANKKKNDETVVDAAMEEEEDENEIISISTSNCSSLPSPDNPLYGRAVPGVDIATSTATTTATTTSTSLLIPSNNNNDNNNNDNNNNNNDAAAAASSSSSSNKNKSAEQQQQEQYLDDFSYGMVELDSGSEHAGQDNNAIDGMDMTSTNQQQQPQRREDDDDDAAAAASAAAATTAPIDRLPDDFDRSPEPLGLGRLLLSRDDCHQSHHHHHQYHLLGQIQEDQASNNLGNMLEQQHHDDNKTNVLSPPLLLHQTTTKRRTPPSSPVHSPVGSPLRRTTGSLMTATSSTSSSSSSSSTKTHHILPQYMCTKIAYSISKRFFEKEDFALATWLGFWALLNVTCSNYVLTPMRDAVALQIGVQHIPKLTLASSLLAFLSSVPIGWLFEAPDPSRRKVWKKMGLTRGATQGTSLALFYRCFALSLLLYAVGFWLIDVIQNGRLGWLLPAGWSFGSDSDGSDSADETSSTNGTMNNGNLTPTVLGALWRSIPYWFTQLGSFMSVTFFLVVHLMKLHSISLVWGVTTEAMEYEDVARKQQEGRVGSHGSLSSLHRQPNGNATDNSTTTTTTKKRTRLQRLALVGFGGTLGGVWGSVLASSLAKILKLPGLLIVAAFLLEVSAELSIELGRVMQKHWEEQSIFRSTQDLTSLDPSMKRSASVGSMKRVASGNSLYAAHQQSMKRVASGNSIGPISTSQSLTELASHQQQHASTDDTTTTMAKGTASATVVADPPPDDNTFTQRLLRGITTILKSRLLMAIFTYNALFASTSVLLSFQRAALVANRNQEGTTVSADTAFLANINMASSIAVFATQASGIGAVVAHMCGSRGSLALMPLIRLLGIIGLCWWHRSSDGQPPNLILFLMLDECTRVVNLSVAKPVRESLWRGLSNEARYESKPIVDTLANRWGAGSASFCVSVVSHVLLFLGQKDRRAPNGDPIVLGLPPVLFLGLIVAAWWLGVSMDLGHIRRRIDIELKKRQ